MARPAAPVTLTINVHSPGYAVPDDFCGVSFGAVAEMPQRGGGFLFSPTNAELITLFRNSGIHNLRLGGSTVEGRKAAHPSHAAIDSVFGFARVADVRVIYSLPLLNGDPSNDADIARYIWTRYRPWIECFAIGNEPDIRRYHYPPFGTGTDPAITNYASYLHQWRKFATAITNAVPGAKFAGPDAANAGNNGLGWTAKFVADEKKSGLVVLATQHLYIGGSPFITNRTDDPKLIPVPKAIDKMLSPAYAARRYPAFFENTLFPVQAEGVPYRMTESDDCLKGVPDASDAFASALWGLDYLHWWAAHGASGVNFHNTEWLKTDTVYRDDTGTYRINPKAYAVRAFDLGSHGITKPVRMNNGQDLNLTAYAVGNATNLCVTIINKEHGAHARAASVTIVPDGFAADGNEVMYLTAPNDNPGAKNDITLGDAPILNNEPWRGQWTPLRKNQILTIPPSAAAIVKMSVN